MFRELGSGMIAGAVGTTALDAATYVDMALRGRPASSTPQQTVDALAERFRRPVPGEGKTRDNRRAGLGAVSGIATGVAVGAAFGALRGLGVRLPVPVGAVLIGAAAMAATDLGMALLGVTDPRTWPVSSWLADAVPHLAYGAVTAVALRALSPS